MGGRNKLKMPEPKPVRMPVMDDGPVRDTRAKTTGDILKRGGQRSTVLSDVLMRLTGSNGLLGR